MKQKLFISFAIFPTILLGSSLSVFADIFDTKADNGKTTFDYSTQNETTILKASDVLGKILEKREDITSISEAEITYLDSIYEFKINDVSNKKYNVSYLENYYWIEAFEDANYSPKYVSVVENSEEKLYEFVRLNKQLIARVPTLSDARIVYACNVNVLPDDANKLLVSAYKTGEEEANNIALKNKYDADVIEYNQYLDDLQTYNQYLKDKAAYDVLKENRDNYLKLKSKYDTDLAKYQKYVDVDYPKYISDLQAYNAYLEELETYNKNKKTYDDLVNAYNEKMAIVDRQLAILDILTTDFGDLALSIHHFINSNSVDVVIERRDEIVTTCGSGLGPAIDEAKEATEAIKQIINAYYEIKDSTKDVRYKWYQSYYTSLRRQVIRLTKCLEHFYTFKMIRDAISEKERTEKYELFVAELIYFCNAISDADVESYSKSYMLDANRKLGGVAGVYASYLKANLLDTSLTSEAFKGALPTAPSELTIVKPTEVKKPTEPTFVSRPVEPAFVAEPTPVEKVAEPDKVNEPVNPNVNIHEELKYLADAYNSSLLFDREKTTEYVTIDVEQKVEINPAKLIDMLVLFDTRTGVNPGYAKFKEIVYYSDPTLVSFATKLTSIVGVFNTDESANEKIFKGKSVVLSDMSKVNAIDLINAQTIELTSYNVVWNHVVNNEEKINFVDIGYSTTGTSYELIYPVYGVDGLIPSQPDVYDGSKRMYSYVFVGYDYTETKDNTESGLSGLSTTDEISEVQGNVTTVNIDVVFDKVPCFDVTFDGQSNISYYKGSKINAPETNPTKESTLTKRYEFIGYSKNGSKDPVSFPVTVEEDIIFTPIFKEINLYKNVFEVDGKVVSTQYVEEGKTPTIPNDISKERTKNSYFTFKSWDSTVVPSTKDIKYVALFDEHKIITNGNIIEDVSALNISMNKTENTADLTDIFSLMENNEIEAKSVNLKFDEATVELNKSLVNYLRSVNGVKVNCERKDLENDDVEFTLKISNSEDVEILNPSLSVPVTLRGIKDIAHCRIFENDNEIAMNVINSDIKVSMKLGNKLVASHYYKISFDKFLSTATFELNGKNVEIGSTHEFKKGDKVTIKATAKEGYRLNCLLINDAYGRRIDLEGETLTIGESDIQISADVEKIMCTINFYVDGVIFQTIHTTYGSFVNLPTNVSKPATEDHYFVFTGWDQEISFVDKDYNLNAKFDVIDISKPKGEDEEKENGMTIGQKLSIGVLAIVVGGFAAAITLIVRKSHKKPQKTSL